MTDAGFSYSPSEELLDLVSMALDHGFGSISDGKSGPLIPFVLFETADGSRQLNRFVADDLQQSVQRALEHVEQLDHQVVRYAVAYDGYVTMSGTKWDAILVQAGERGHQTGVAVGQRYQRKTGWFAKGFEQVGNAAILGPADQRLHPLAS